MWTRFQVTGSYGVIAMSEAMVFAGRLCSLVASLALFMALSTELTPQLAGEVFAADAYYLPLREILPEGDQRDAVESSIVETSMRLNRHGHMLKLVTYGIGLAAAVAVSLVIWRMPGHKVRNDAHP
jgi:hypothetical protein